MLGIYITNWLREECLTVVSTELEFQTVPSGNRKLNQRDWSSYLSYKS